MKIIIIIVLIKSLHVDIDMATDGSMHPQSKKQMYAGRFVAMVAGLALRAQHVPYRGPTTILYFICGNII